VARQGKSRARIAPASCSSSPSETDESAGAITRAADYFYNRCLHVAAGFADAPGYRTMKTVKSGLMAQIGAAAQRQREGLTWKDFIEQGYIIAGSPQTVRQQLEEVAKGLNVGHMMLLLHFGNMSKEQVTKNTSLRARGRTAPEGALQRVGRQVVDRAACGA
jgi:alkanesulfonate monooxygenase SsuD/methylene tetrahydromethanopterin reductase-like flavin-dependent oxidoreductase (luciferase family)